MRTRLLILLLLALLPACKTVTTPPVAPSVPSTDKLLSAKEKELEAERKKTASYAELLQSASGDVYGIDNVAQLLEPVNAAEAVRSHVSVLQAKLPPPTAEQKLAKERENALFLTGQLEEAKKSTQAVLSEAQKLRLALDEAARRADAATRDAQVALERYKADQQTEQRRLQELLNAKDAEIKRARAEAYETRNRVIFYTLVGIGAAMFVAGAGLLVVSKGTRIIEAVIAGVLSAVAFGIAKLISHPWFNVVFSSFLALVAVAVGVVFWYEWKRKQALDEGSLAKDALARMAKAVDHFKIEAPDEARKLISRVKEEHDAAHKRLIDSLRGKPNA